MTNMRARELSRVLTRYSDGENVPQLLELIAGTSDYNNHPTARETTRCLFMQTPEFETAFQMYMSRFEESQVTQIEEQDSMAA